MYAQTEKLFHSNYQSPRLASIDLTSLPINIK